MIDLLKDTRPRAILFIVMLGAALWFPHHGQHWPGVAGDFPFDRQPMPLYRLFRLIAPTVWLNIALGFILVMAQAFLVTYLNLSYRLSQAQTFMPAYFFLMFSTLYVPLQRVHPVLFANFFLILALNELFDTVKKEKAIENAFNAGVYVSVASLFHFPSLFLAGFTFLGLLVMRPFVWREWGVMLLGVAMPYAVTAGILFLLDLPLAEQFAFGPMGVGKLQDNWPLLGFMAFWVLLGWLSGVLILNRISMKLETRKFFVMVLALLLFSVGIFVLWPPAFLELLPYTAFSLSILFARVAHFWEQTPLLKALLGILILGVAYLQFVG